MAAKTAERFAACFDTHGDMQDDGAVSVFHDFCKIFKPTIRVHGGDAFNFASLRKGATEQEKREKVADDIERGLEFIRTYKPTHFLRGNHDERLWDCASGDDGKLADFASYLITDIKDALGNAVMYPYDKRAGVMKLGHLKLIHGYNSGITAARLAAQVYGSCLMGHLHTIDQFSIPGLERRVGRVCGCLCKLDQQYNRAQMNTLRQAHGWAYGLVLPSGEYVFYQAECVGGKWYIPTEMKELAASDKRKA